MIKIDGVIFKQMIISGTNNLYNSYPEIDNLNVFPVPDGDTGTNMNLTMQSGVKEVSNKNDASIAQVAKDFARGLLMGARGNSGVILSQIFRGFSEGLEGKGEVDAIALANAFMSAKNVAYKAVMRPVEGTILTVIREASQALYDKAEKNMPIDECMDLLLDEARKSLQRTPELLPVLKEVGVVDSGGAGLCKVLEGFAKALHNEIVEKSMPSVTETGSYSTGKPAAPKEDVGNVQSKFEHKEFGYCTQFLMEIPEKLPRDKKAFNEKRFKAVLEAHGNSIVCVCDGSLVKVHIHTLKPGNILTYAQQFGEFKMIKIDNMTEQHEELMFEDKEMKEEAGVLDDPASPKIEVTTSAPDFSKKESERKEYALISVAVGEGIERLFTDLSVDYIVSGGQTMNPSTADFVDAIKKVHAKNVFIFPNNGNILMAATQAGELMKEECNVVVIPTKTIPEGLVACMVYNPGSSVEENVDSMKENILAVKSGEVTYAIKDTTIDGVTVAKDHFMGITGKKIVCCHKHKINTLMDMLRKMVDDESQIITILTGQDVTKEEFDTLSKKVKDAYSDSCDISIEEGKQPVYSFFVSVE